ncbi:MAG: pyrroline-5-carboxylate reductase dimerization domain-containing protein [Gillisia sp.]
MSKIGFIGFGSMGSMLVKGFLESGVLLQDQIIVSTRTKEKFRFLSERWPAMLLTNNNVTVAQHSDILFLCVKPLETIPLLYEIKEHIQENCHLVSIAAGVRISNLEALYKGKITKVIPSLTSEVKEGTSLFCHNCLVAQENASTLETMFQGIGKVKIINENDFEVAADLTSCAPGMIAAIFQNFLEGGLRHSDLSPETAYEMVVSTLLGTAKLLKDKKMNFSELISRVATKGGITEEGVQVLNHGLPDIFNDVFAKTLAKHEHVKQLVSQDVEKIIG